MPTSPTLMTTRAMRISDQRQAPIVARRCRRHWIFARPVVATATDIVAPPTGLVTVSVPAFTHGAGVAVVAPR